MTATEYKSEFSMWAILASPMVVTTPILNCSKTDQINGNFTPGRCRPSITPLQQEILLNMDVLAVNQDVLPAGKRLGAASATGAATYARNLSDASVAVAFYNPSDSQEAFTLNFTELGWVVGTPALVRDLWSHKDLGVFKNQFPNSGESAKVEPHGTMMLRVTPNSQQIV